MLVVYDESVPNGVGLVAVAPFYVVDYTPAITFTAADQNMAAKSVINPGDNVLVKTTLTNAPDKGYFFATFAVPESDYKGKVDVNSTGILSDMNLTVDAFTVHFSGNYNDTLMNASTNLTWAQQYVLNNFKNSNLSAAVGSSQGKSLEMPVKLNSNAMTGKYILVTAAIDRATHKVVALGQTTFDVVAVQQADIWSYWWLILLLIIVILIIVAVYWLFIRKKE
jgi:methanogen extracellular protein (TIGR04279 family)